MEIKDSERLRLALLRMSDSRKEVLMRYANGRKPTYEDVVNLSRMFKALALTIANRKLTQLRGLGVFEWKPWRNKIPTGELVRSWRLTFHLNQELGYKKGSRQ